MIRRLQKRMILLVVCGLLLASAGLVFAVNWINWQPGGGHPGYAGRERRQNG